MNASNIQCPWPHRNSHLLFDILLTTCCIALCHSQRNQKRVEDTIIAFIPPRGDAQWIQERQACDTFIHYHFNIATMHNQPQYSEPELRKQISGKPKEFFLFFFSVSLRSACSWHMATYLQQEFICRYIKKSVQGQIKLCNKTQPRRNIACETYGTVKNYHLRR